ncbi:MAG: rRNA pseudouridine synthase [Nitrospirae bacterium]|nr:rRNA pseudouridine synthase [Nitrospirota bacterium]
MEKRIQKILSEIGITSRRKAEKLILEGKVTVNGKVAMIGTKADPEKDYIKVDGKLITDFMKDIKKVYLMFNKPKGVVTTLFDPEGRNTIKDFLKGVKYRVFPVGRLDYDSEGLLLLTNDGDFAHAVMHPSKKISKTYLMKVKGVLKEEDIDKLRKGVKLESTSGGEMTLPAKVKRVRKGGVNSWLEITIYEGKKRQIRRMFEKIGYPVLKLKRIRVDGLEIGDLEPGAYRYLSPEEISKIKQEVLNRT